MVLTLDGRPALEFSARRSAAENKAVSSSLRSSLQAATRASPALEGYRSSRRGIVIDADLQQGDKLCFAVRDPHTPKPISPRQPVAPNTGLSFCT